MKRVFIIFIILGSIGFAKANPIVVPDVFISELAFNDKGSCIIEISLPEVGGSGMLCDSLVLHSLSSELIISDLTKLYQNFLIVLLRRQYGDRF